MPIQVQYDMPPSSYALLGLQTGQGQKAERNLDRRNQRRAQDRQFSLTAQGQSDAMERFYAGIDAQMEAAALQHQYGQETDQNRYERDTALQELRNEGYAQRSGYGTSSGRGYNIRPDVTAALKAGTVEYTPQQNRQLAGLNQAENWWRTSPNLTPDQRAAGLSQVQSKRQEVLDNPAGRVPDPANDFADKIEKNVVPYFNPSTGKQEGIFFPGKDGTYEFRPLSAKDLRLSAWTDAVENSKNDMKEVDLDLAKKIYADGQSITSGPPPGQATPTPQPTPQPTPPPRKPVSAEGLFRQVIDYGMDIKSARFAELGKQLSQEEKIELALKLKNAGLIR